MEPDSRKTAITRKARSQSVAVPAAPPISFDAKVDQLSQFWKRMLSKDQKQYAEKMERIRREEEAPSPPALYMSDEQQLRHQLVFHYVDGLQRHESRVERQKAMQDTRNLIQTVVLMEKQK